MSETSQVVQGPFRVNTSIGAVKSIISSEWFRRPDDERFLDLQTLHDSVESRRSNSFEETVDAGGLRFVGSDEEPDTLRGVTPSGAEVFPTHWSFGQLTGLAKMNRATEILRSQPSWLAGLNLSWGLAKHSRGLRTKVYGNRDNKKLVAATGPDYGRIWDADVVKLVMRLAGNGTSDTRWKVPGVLNWQDMTHNPYVDVTRSNTTLYASDRDVCIFLCDDTHPIEIGRLANGDPDLAFQGFYILNSEVGFRALKMATFWLRGVCLNRNLWGVTDFSELTIVHRKYGNDRFLREAEPALSSFVSGNTTTLLAGINAAKAANVASDNEERMKFLTSEALGFSLKKAQAILETHEREEGRPASTAWDFNNAITAFAREIPRQDERLDMEIVAAKIMDRATRNA